MKHTFLFAMFSISLVFISYSLTPYNSVKEYKIKAVHCYEFRVTCAGKSGFYDTVQASSWSEATKKINAKYPNCKATQVKQKDC
jgi:hypothetical protein